MRGDGGTFEGADATEIRRLFCQDARRRLWAVVDALGMFEHRHHRRAAAWTYRDVGEVSQRIEDFAGSPEVSSADLDDALTKLEVGIGNVIDEADVDRPIPYEPIPFPAPPRLVVVKGGRA